MHARRLEASGHVVKLLLIEDNPLDAELVLRELARGGHAFAVTRADDERSVIDALVRERHDIVISDYDLRGYDGMRALGEVQRRAPEVPFILVSGTIDEELAVRAMQSGATDYLLKDRLSRLGGAVTRALEQAALVRRQREIARALADAEERYRSLFENAIEGIISCAVDGTVIDANPALARMFGYDDVPSFVAAVPRPLSILLERSADRTSVYTMLQRGVDVRSVDVVGRRKDGSKFSARVNAREVHAGPAGRHFEGSIEDTTEQHALEQQLYRAQRLDSLGRLAAGIAHDLNNMLLPIMVSQGLLRAAMTDEKERELLDAIEINARRGAATLKQLLTFARGTSGERVPVRVDTIVDEMSSIMSTTFPRSIAVTITRYATDAYVVGDAAQLHQVLMNLCVNARDAMPEGGTLDLSLDVRPLTPTERRAQPSAREGDHVVLSVADTGAGIEKVHLDRIFEPFFTTKAPGRGTGLGLASSLGIVKGHGGFVTVDSQLGAGSTFSIFLPLGASDAAASRVLPPVPSLRGAERLVLIVDDEDLVRRVVRVALERLQFQVVEAMDGEQALDVLRTRGSEIELVLTDLSMPRLDGIGLARRARELAPGTPIIAMTGGLSADEFAALQSLGIAAVLEKPFSIDRIVASVERVLAGEGER